VHTTKTYVREKVQLHTLLTLYSSTLCPQTISWSLLYVNLPSPPQHFISYQMEQVILPLITYLGIPVFMGYDFWPHLPKQPSTKWDLVLHVYECVWSASHYTCFTLGENALSTNCRGGCIGQRFGLEPCRSRKSLDPART